jgi:hypothetical protein
MLLPITSFIVSIFVGPLMGYFLHVFAMGLVYDILLRRLPKILLVIPAIPYLIYYGFFLGEHATVRAIEKDIQSQNPAQILQFDPEQHHLVYKTSEEHAIYKTPVTYRYHEKYGYTGYRIASRNLCDQAKELGIKTNSIYTQTANSHRRGMLYFNICKLRMKETPRTNKISITQNSKTEGKLSITEYKFFENGKPIGTFNAANYDKMPLIPTFTAMCNIWFYTSGNTNLCKVEMMRSQRELNTFNSQTDHKKYRNNVIASMLNIDLYTRSDLVRFTDYPETVAMVNEISSAKGEANQE